MHEGPIIWVGGELTRSLPLPDRGLEFGDGLFETLLLHRGKPLYQSLHLDRLQCGLQTLGFTDCMSEVTHHLQAAAQEVDSLGWLWSALRVTVTRGSGPRGYAPPESSDARVIIQATSISRDCALMPAAATLGVASIRLAQQPALAGIKHLNRLENVMAAQQARQQAVDEIILLDQSDDVVSVSAGNLYLVREGSIFTPPLMGAGVAGTRRRLIFQEWASAIGVPIIEAALTLPDIEAAHEVFYSNSLQTVRPVSAVGSVKFSDHSVCGSLFELFKSALT